MRSRHREFYEAHPQTPQIAVQEPTFSRRLELVLAVLRHRLNGKGAVIDAGCGGASLASALANAGYRVMGTDVSFNALAEARKIYPDLALICHEIDNRWPIRSQVVDAIICTEVVEHVFGVREMLTEMNRVLRRGGLLIVTTPYHGLLKNLLIVLFRFDAHFCDLDGGHIRFLTNRSLGRLLSQSGFRVIEWRYIGRIRALARSVFVLAEKVGDV